MTRRVLVAAALLAATTPLAAQGVDRTQPPPLGPAPELRLPPVQRATLRNGIRLYVVEMHEVPLVQVSLAAAGGGREDGALAGLASFTAGMLDEGAGSRDAFGIAEEAEFLGAQLTTGADWDRIAVTLRVPKRTLGPALDLMADVALRPTFAAREVARQRDLRLAAILQQRDQPNAMASLAFGALVFPASHHYHRPLGGDSASTAALDSATVRAFYQRAMQPGRISIIVTGDITLAQARRELDRRFGALPAGAAAAAAPVPPPVPLSPATVYLVDKPGAAQSVLAIGHPGVERANPDYFAIEVMNTILGGSFSSRLMTNLRETKGYTYGASSRFQYGPVAGPFRAGAAVRTDVTDSSLVEFFREFARIRDSAVTDAELARAKAYVALGLTGDFETTRQMAAKVEELLTFGLPLDYYDGYVARIMAVTAADVQRVAQKYLRPDRMSIVVVGDVAKIRPGIEALKLGPVSVRTLDGKAVGP